MTEAPEAPIELPKSERQHINAMAEKFKALTAQAKPEKAAVEPAAAPTAEPAKPEFAAPPEIRGRAREQFQTLENLKRKYQKDYETLKPQFDSLKAELEAIKKNGGNTAELDTLRAQLSERDKVLAAVAIEKHPKFQQHFTERVQAAAIEAAQVVGTEHAATVEQIFKSPASPQRDKQVEELAAGLSNFKALDLLESYKTLKRTEKDREAELSKAPDTVKLIAQENERRAKDAELQLARQRAGLLQLVATELESDFTDANDPMTKEAAADVKRFIEGADGKLDGKLYVRTVADAMRYRKAQKTMAEQTEIITKLQTQLNEIQNATPGVRPSTTSTERKTKPPLDNSDLGPTFRRLTGGVLR